MRKLRHREVRKVSQGHTACQWQNQDFNPRSLDPSPCRCHEVSCLQSTSPLDIWETLCWATVKLLLSWSSVDGVLCNSRVTAPHRELGTDPHRYVWAQTLLLLRTPFPFSCLPDSCSPFVIQQFSFVREGDCPGWAAQKQKSNCRWFLGAQPRETLLGVGKQQRREGSVDCRAPARELLGDGGPQVVLSGPAGALVL